MISSVPKPVIIPGEVDRDIQRIQDSAEAGPVPAMWEFIRAALYASDDFDNFDASTPADRLIMAELVTIEQKYAVALIEHVHKHYDELIAFYTEEDQD